MLRGNITLTNIMKSENVPGADNQQERSAFIGWIVGFVDGEGCFTVSFFKHPKSRLRLKWQVFPEFVITQGIKSKNSLKEICKFFECGSIYLNKRYDNHHNHLVKYVVRNRIDLLTKIIPFFEAHPLKTAKRKDFEYFARIIKMMNKNQHLDKKGLEKIRAITAKMNTRKYR
jgi:hypothetical protein